MAKEQDLRERILARLRSVINPETGADVVRMRLIEDLTMGDNGHVKYKFHPSSPFCPLAVTLALEIRRAVAGVPGVVKQEIEVVGYVGAQELNKLLQGEVTD